MKRLRVGWQSVGRSTVRVTKVRNGSAMVRRRAETVRRRTGVGLDQGCDTQITLGGALSHLG